MQNNQHSENSILELVKWIDDHQNQVMKPLDIIFNWKGGLVLSVAFVFVIVEVFNFLTSTNFDKVFTLLTLLVIYIAFATIVFQTAEFNAIDAHLRNATRIRKFDEEEVPFLKALIKLKSKNKSLKLSVLYAIDKKANGGIFTENKLLETICR